jgi:hypothetical protein
MYRGFGYFLRRRTQRSTIKPAPLNSIHADPGSGTIWTFASESEKAPPIACGTQLKAVLEARALIALEPSTEFHAGPLPPSVNPNPNQ